MTEQAKLYYENDEGILYQFPALELSLSSVDNVSEWNEKWMNAGNSIQWKGAVKNKFVALRKSPIWNALGKLNGCLGNPYPPYKQNSWAMWLCVDREECIRLGLMLDDFCKSNKLTRSERDILEAVDEVRNESFIDKILKLF